MNRWEPAYDRIRGRILSDESYRTGRLSPALSYGRHRGPSAHRIRRAVVMMALIEFGDTVWIPLTARPSHLKHHGGQISLPGGGVDDGESNEQTAVREFTEELGIEPDVIEVLGHLSPIHVYASGHLVDAVVARVACPPLITTDPDDVGFGDVSQQPKRGGNDECNVPAFDWTPDPREVDRVVMVSVDQWWNHGPPERQMIRRPVWRDGESTAEISLATPMFEIGGEKIWGATAILLDELAQLLR